MNNQLAYLLKPLGIDQAGTGIGYFRMILVTGGTNFIGRSVLRQLTAYDHEVRTLLEPTPHTPALPHRVPVDVALASLQDRRGVRAALVGIDTVVHLADNVSLIDHERDLQGQVEGTRTLVEACADAGVKRLIYLSLIGADRASAYVAMRARATAEECLRSNAVAYTILRSTIVFGRSDQFTIPLAQLLAVAPLFFPIPGDGSVLLQPLWVEDLATCITWILDEPGCIGETFEIGGPEYHSLREIVQMVMHAASSPRIVFATRPPYLRAAARFLRRFLRYSPVSPLWVDYLAVSRTTDLNSLPSILGLQPSRMEGQLQYLQERNWGWDLLARQFKLDHGG